VRIVQSGTRLEREGLRRRAADGALVGIVMRRPNRLPIAEDAAGGFIGARVDG